MKKAMNYIQRLLKNERGQGMVEYGIVVGLVAVIAIALFSGTGTGTLKTAVNTLFSDVAGKIDITP